MEGGVCSWSKLRIPLKKLKNPRSRKVPSNNWCKKVDPLKLVHPIESSYLDHKKGQYPASTVEKDPQGMRSSS